MPARDRDEGNCLGVVTNLLDEGRRLLDDFVEAILAPLRILSVTMYINAAEYADLGGVHLVDGDDELTYTKGEGKESVLSGLAILGDTGFELTSTTRNDEDGTVGLRGTGNHVLDEVTMSRGINDLSSAYSQHHHCRSNEEMNIR